MVDSGLLQIYALGELRFLIDGNPISELRSRKARAMLVYLACTGKSQPREVLVDMFWSESSQQQAMSNLRDALSNLRKHLNPFLNISRYSIEFNPDSRIWSDIEELKRAAARSQSGAKVIDPKTILDFEKTIALYQGNFLEGFFLKDARGFNEWQLIERERIQMSVLELALTLSQYYEMTGDYKKGIKYARQSIEIEPIMEAGYQQIIRLLDSSGRSSEAIIAYEKCRETLSKELDVEPSEETKSLYAALLKGERLQVDFKKRPPHNLLLPLPAIIGREDDLKQIARCLIDPTCRLLTLIGVGGIGKTTLGYHAAAAALDTFPDGVWLVELAAFTEKGLLPEHIASVFGVSAQEDKIGRGITNILIEILKTKNMLLVLDNCEHLIEECAAFVNHFINGCPQVKVLATSREVLGIPLECIFQVGPLFIPDENTKFNDIQEASSVRLFIERATLLRSSFGITHENVDVLADICRQLDGIPLAIELAASRVKVLSLYQIAERLKDRFQILTGGPRTALPRHQTLQATMDWSYNFLSKEEQAVLRRLSIFSGGWSIQSAEEVVCLGDIKRGSILDLLTQLVDKSLVCVEEKTDEMRYYLLETVREYSTRKLTEENELRKTRLSHANFFTLLAEEADLGLRDSRQIDSLELLDTEHDNIRSALSWSIDNDEADLALRLVGAMGWFWFMRGHWVESSRWLARALDLKSDADPKNLAKSLIRAGGLQIIRGNLVGTIGRIEEAESIYKKTGDIEGLAWCKNLLGQSKTWNSDDFPLAGPVISEGIDLFQSIQDAWGVAWSLRYSGHVIEFLGDYDRGLAIIKESYHNFLEIGDLWNAAHSSLFVGNAAYRYSDLIEARFGFELCLDNCQKVEDKVMEAHALKGLASIALKQDDFNRAEVMFLNAIDALQKLGDDNCTAVAQRDLAQVKQHQGNFDHSIDLLRQSLLTHLDSGFDYQQIWTIECFAALAVEMGLGERAARLLAVGGGHLSDVAVPVYSTEEHNKLITATKEILGDQAYEKYFTEGEAMSLDEAIAYALEENLKT